MIGVEGVPIVSGGRRIERPTVRRSHPRRGATGRTRALRACLAEQGLDAAAAYEVVLAADEAFINAVTHAGNADAMIRVSARASGNEVSVEIRNRGGGLTYRKPDPPSVPGVCRAHGRGVFLMGRLTDEVSVKSGRRRTIVRMSRRVA